MRVVADVALACDEPWWVIGGAAARLVGLGDEAVADVDVLTTGKGAQRIARALGTMPCTPPPSDRFRSATFVRSEDTPITIEVMGDLHLHSLDWEILIPRDRIMVEYGGAALFMPSIAEQIRILALFGRDKDTRRAARLSRMVSERSPHSEPERGPVQPLTRP